VSSVTDEIKARVDLVELIGRTVQLRRSGTSYKGLCPFHQEKTPSFYVFPASHTFVCFGCGKKGSAFDWLMEREHLEFGEALRTLAQMTGVELRTNRDASEDEATGRLYQLVAAAQTYYHGLLLGTAGGAARRYLVERGVNDESIEAFALGYAPAGGGLGQHLRAAGFSEPEQLAAGLSSVADDGHHFDFFRDRLLFPIVDVRGRTIAFGGRVLRSEQQPKYLNSRDTLLFHKQETLFAFNLARRAVLAERQVVIVEGYMDAVIAHQHRYRNVVATLGTAVTERHLRQLRRLVDDVVLALDSDAAGQAATWRALEVAEDSLRDGVTPVVGPNRRQRRYAPATPVRLRVLTLPGAKDPDELIRSAPEQWPGLVRAASSVIDFVLARLESRHDLSTAEGKASAADEMGEVLARVANPIEQQHYVQQVADLLKVREEAVLGLVRRKQRGLRSERADQRDVEGEALNVDEPVERDTLDEYALALLLHLRRQATAAEGSAVESWQPTEADFVLPQSRALLKMVLTQADATLAVPPALEPSLRRVEAHLPVIEQSSRRQLERAVDEVQLQLQQRMLLTRRRQAQHVLREAASDQERSALLEELDLIGLPHALQDVDDRLEQSSGRRTARAGAR
jgi:DNA primase